MWALGVQDVRIREGITVALGGTLEEEESPPSRPEATPTATQSPQAPAKELTEEQRKAEQKKKEGNELYKARKFEEALKAYDEAIALDPNELLYLNNKAGQPYTAPAVLFNCFNKLMYQV